MYAYGVQLNVQKLYEQRCVTKSESVHSQMPVWTSVFSNVYDIEYENLWARVIGVLQLLDHGVEL